MSKALKSLYITSILITFIVSRSLAQTNSTVTKVFKDSVFTDTTAQSPVLKRAHSPRTAWYLSAIVPGAGQVFNRKLWKVPVIYSGFAYGLYLYYNLNKSYIMYRDPYKKGLTHPDTIFYIKNISLTLAQVQEQRDYYRKNRDLTIICISAWYVLNIVDACVDAYFFDYDMSDKLSVHIKPSMYYSNRQNYYAGVTLLFHAK
jgi:hypothetical protein